MCRVPNTRARAMARLSARGRAEVVQRSGRHGDGSVPIRHQLVRVRARARARVGVGVRVRFRVGVRVRVS